MQQVLVRYAFGGGGSGVSTRETNNEGANVSRARVAALVVTAVPADRSAAAPEQVTIA